MNKSISIKIPLSLAHTMDDRAQLNPAYFSRFIMDYICLPVPEESFQEKTLQYSFKVDDKLHRFIKIKSMDNNLSMNEMLGRLLVKHYK